MICIFYVIDMYTCNVLHIHGPHKRFHTILWKLSLFPIFSLYKPDHPVYKATLSTSMVRLSITHFPLLKSFTGGRCLLSWGDGCRSVLTRGRWCGLDNVQRCRHKHGLINDNLFSFWTVWDRSPAYRTFSSSFLWNSSFLGREFPFFDN